LFHHFSGKDELGYAVVEEFLVPAVNHWWIQPLAETEDPVPAIQGILRRFRNHVEHETPESGFVFNGCPVCNYATEMSPLDEGFRGRLEALYDEWRDAIAGALRRGQKSGTVRRGVKPDEEAAFLVACLAGTASTGKVSRKLAHFQSCYRLADRYVGALKA
nr:TetR/AcrR family transcriptional regulator [Akkermansiaceae bacterium]